MKNKIDYKKDNESTLTTAYQRFVSKVDIIESIPSKEWTISDSLVYILFKYKEKFGMSFVLTYKDSPSSSPEYKLATRMWQALEAKKTDGEIIKDYIDYFFKFYSGKKQFTSIAIFSRPVNITNYRRYKANIEKPTRATPLPNKFIDIALQFKETEYLKTYGDLAFLKQSIAEMDETPETFRKFFQLLKTNGLNISVLDRVT